MVPSGFRRMVVDPGSWGTWASGVYRRRPIDTIPAAVPAATELARADVEETLERVRVRFGAPPHPGIPE